MSISKSAIEAAAKAIADEIGHGMSEKCFDHARAALNAAMPYIREQVLEEACSHLEELSAELRKSTIIYHQAQAAILIERTEVIRDLKTQL